MKCVTVLSNSTSGFGYCNVSLLPLKKWTRLMIFFIFNLNCLNNPAKKRGEGSRFLTVFPIWLVQSSPYFTLVLLEMSLFLDIIEKRGYFCLIVTLHVESVVVLSPILYNSRCCPHPSFGGGGVDNWQNTGRKQRFRVSGIKRKIKKR